MQRRTADILPAAILLASVTATMLLLATASSAARSEFDHLTTGFRLEGAHGSAECESCHTRGMFLGTPTDCVGCHSQGNQVRATWQPPTHLPTSERCESCHRPFSWVPVVRFDHLEAMGSCSSCHNNMIVSGQPPTHIVAPAECDSCHNTRFWR